MNRDALRCALLCALFGTLLAACESGAEEDYFTTEPASERAKWVWPDDREYLPRNRLDAPDVLALVEAKGEDGRYRLRSVDALLASAPLTARGPAAVGHAMYMEKTRGLFKNAPDGPVSARTPRALGVAGTTVLTVQNDAKDAASFDTIEMIATDIETAEVDFYLLDLKSDEASKRVQKNPERCNGCHDGRFIWGMYPFWPGRKAWVEEGSVRRWFGRASDISFTIALYELNLARIARELLQSRAYLTVERPVIAALLDCPLENFPFAANQEFAAHKQRIASAFWRDVATLIDDTIERNGEKNLAYTIDKNGEVQNRISLNRNDPVRLALVDWLLRDARADVDLSRWAISRKPGETSLNFQTSGAIGVSRLAFYLLHNSPNAAALKRLVPDNQNLGYSSEVKTPDQVCRDLTRGLAGARR